MSYTVESFEMLHQLNKVLFKVYVYTCEGSQQALSSEYMFYAGYSKFKLGERFHAKGNKTCKVAKNA